MKPLEQLFAHRPKEGTVGDCFRTSLAMLLGYESPEEVPHIVEEAGEWVSATEFRDGTKEEFHARVDAFLHPLDLVLLEISFTFETVDQVLEHMGTVQPDLAYMLSGQSSRGCDHAIVCIGGKVFKDPSPDGTGLIGPTSEGSFFTSFLVHQPKFLARKEK